MPSQKPVHLCVSIRLDPPGFFCREIVEVRSSCRGILDLLPLQIDGYRQYRSKLIPIQLAATVHVGPLPCGLNSDKRDRSPIVVASTIAKNCRRRSSRCYHGRHGLLGHRCIQSIVVVAIQALFYICNDVGVNCFHVVLPYDLDQEYMTCCNQQG